VNFHAWIIKGDSMEACSIPITARLRDHFPVQRDMRAATVGPIKSHYQHQHGRSGTHRR
jgi:hypothetical protein